MSPITAAIQKGRRWLDRFTRWEYRKAFPEYVNTHWEACRLQLEEHRNNPEALAEQVLDQLADGRKKMRLWNRGAEIFDEKQTVIKYLCPMLLQKGEEEFARQLRAAWCRRWPKDPFEIAGFEELDKSFVNVIMGITLKNDR